MARIAGALASCAILCLASGGYAKTHNREEPLDPAKGFKLASRIPCDGETNPQDHVGVSTTFSAGGGERSFRIDRFEATYCKRGDLGFACLNPGKALWKQEWSVASSAPEPNSSTSLDSCSDWQAHDSPQYVLTGWYRMGGADSKLPWIQAQLKKTPSRWEIYEFTDPDGASARIEIDHR